MINIDSSLLQNKPLLLTFSLLSCGLFACGAYKILTSPSKQPTKINSKQLHQQQQQISKQLTKLQQLQLLLSKKAQQIQIKYMKNMPHVLSSQSIKQIFSFTSSIIDKQQLQNIYNNNRKARRTILPLLKHGQSNTQNQALEWQTYYRFVCTFQQQIQYLIQKAQKDFVIFLNLDYNVITESIEYHMCQTQTGLAQWIKNWSFNIKQQLKQKLTLYQKTAEPTTILNIIKYQIQMLKSQGQNIIKSIKNLHLQTDQQQQAIPIFLQLYLQDIIYQKYQLQIEQLNIGTMQMNNQFEENLKVLSELQNNLVKEMMFHQYDQSQEYQSEGDYEEEV